MGYGYLASGQTSCHDARGARVACAGTGQDAEFGAGVPWPAPRFLVEGPRVHDRLTGLMWPVDANIAGLPMTWPEALAWVAELNEARFLGFADWRLPNRRELVSLTSRQTRKPALPEGHPFRNVFSHWYWSATTAAPAPAHAWCVHFEGARLFYGGKDQSYLAWPVRGTSILPATGQIRCFDATGRPVDCAGTRQDGDCRAGVPWPVPRFEIRADGVLDHLTGLVWQRQARLGTGPMDWSQALAAVAALRQEGHAWRLPNILELESLVDCDCGRDVLPPRTSPRAVMTGARRCQLDIRSSILRRVTGLPPRACLSRTGRGPCIWTRALSVSGRNTGPTSRRGPCARRCRSAKEGLAHPTKVGWLRYGRGGYIRGAAWGAPAGASPILDTVFGLQ